jgi:hypothetical protein
MHSLQHVSLLRREHFADLIYFLLPHVGVVSTNAPGSPQFVLKTGVVFSSGSRLIYFSAKMAEQMFNFSSDVINKYN